MKPLIIAHRGDMKLFPENTIEAFESAFKKGADGIELDTHLDTEDNIIVVHDYMHDKSKSYPCLSTVIERFGQMGRIEIEIKSLNPKSITKIKDIINKYNPKDIELTSSIVPLFPYIKSAFPNEKIGLIFREDLSKEWMTQDFKEKLIISYLKLTGANILHLELENYTSILIDQLKSINALTHTHLAQPTLNHYNKILELGINQFTTNDLEIINLIQEKSK